MLEGDQHQAEPDPHSTEVARAGHRTPPKHEHADQDEQKGYPRQVEGQHLDDQGGAHVGTQHDRQRRHEIDEPAGCKCRDHQPGCRAALEN